MPSKYKHLIKNVYYAADETLLNEKITLYCRLYFYLLVL